MYYIFNLIIGGELILENDKSLAKAYAFKSIYVFFSCLINVLNFLKFENSYAVFIGLLMFNGSCIVEHYFKYTYNLATIFLRRLGYLIPTFCIIIIVSVALTYRELNIPDSYVYNSYTISVIIIISIIQVIISGLDIMLYGFNNKSIKMMKYTENQINENREKSAKVTNNRTKRVSKNKKKYNRTRGRR